MKMALALLDRDLEILAAYHLQHAIELTEQSGAADCPAPVERQTNYSSH